MASVAVIGGGISGLSAAHALSKHGGDKVGKVVLYEASQRVGGWLQSTQFEDGSLFEHGPRSVRNSANAALQLVEEVGLADQVISIPRTHPAAIKRMIYAKGQLNLLPNKAEDLFSVTPPLTTKLLKPLFRELWVKKSKEEDESVYDFFGRRFGDQVRCHKLAFHGFRWVSYCTAD
ncbi:hypothetical protein RvY_16388 [Ramazzottius varieornatus]|uniref:Protoporphyrinogen oxidase n=1 Tax=Ramazzottius varieornatus TaxID=947166 RepID=A0A1D1W5V5_RAMVA|nr:hypothetical protein RvY_16388 [Ramazzottius varieornatus]